MDPPDELRRVGDCEDAFDPFAMPGFDVSFPAIGAILFVEALESFPRGHRPVVDAAGSAIARVRAFDRFLRRREQVRLDAHQFPQFVEQVQFRQLVPVVKRVPAHDVVVA